MNALTKSAPRNTAPSTMFFALNFSSRVTTGHSDSRATFAMPKFAARWHAWNAATTNSVPRNVSRPKPTMNTAGRMASAAPVPIFLMRRPVPTSWNTSDRMPTHVAISEKMRARSAVSRGHRRDQVRLHEIEERAEQRQQEHPQRDAAEEPRAEQQPKPSKMPPPTGFLARPALARRSSDPTPAATAPPFPAGSRTARADQQQARDQQQVVHADGRDELARDHGPEDAPTEPPAATKPNRRLLCSDE